jgi:Na+/proline symporter
VEQYHLPIFIINTILVLGATALGYHLAPRLMAGMDEPQAVKAGVRTTRGLLPLVVMLYMFFNCLGYFEGRTAYLLGVSGLVLVDFALQLLMSRRRRVTGPDDREDGE